MSDELLRRIKLYERELERLRAFEVPVKSPIFLTVPLTSGSWNGGSFSTVGASTQLDLSAVFGAPAGVKAALLEVVARDSAAWGTSGLFVSLGPSAIYYYTATVRPAGGDVLASMLCVAPCDVNGDLWYQIAASGVNTMDVWIRIWGYWLP